jgi:hypothetical protein
MFTINSRVPNYCNHHRNMPILSEHVMEFVASTIPRVGWRPASGSGQRRRWQISSVVPPSIEVPHLAMSDNSRWIRELKEMSREKIRATVGKPWFLASVPNFYTFNLYIVLTYIFMFGLIYLELLFRRNFDFWLLSQLSTESYATLHVEYHFFSGTCRMSLCASSECKHFKASST